MTVYWIPNLRRSCCIINLSIGSHNFLMITKIENIFASVFFTLNASIIFRDENGFSTRCCIFGNNKQWCVFMLIPNQFCVHQFQTKSMGRIYWNESSLIEAILNANIIKQWLISCGDISQKHANSRVIYVPEWKVVVRGNDKTLTVMLLLRIGLLKRTTGSYRWNYAYNDGISALKANLMFL